MLIVADTNRYINIRVVVLQIDRLYGRVSIEYSQHVYISLKTCCTTRLRAHVFYTCDRSLTRSQHTMILFLAITFILLFIVTTACTCCYAHSWISRRLIHTSNGEVTRARMYMRKQLSAIVNFIRIKDY